MTERQKIHIARPLWSDAMAVHTDGRKKSMRRVSVTIFASSGTLMKSIRILKEMRSDLVELRVHAHRNEKLAVVVWSGAACANRKYFSSTPGSFSGVATPRILQGERHGVTPIHLRSGNRNEKPCGGGMPCAEACR